ncbi:GNAT family N-acetyltransferase [Bacteroides reticulotermitis]|uniref:WavS protein n=2 Tax=Bacteroides reticulotermitis TaxID=1133319 RepID=W4UQ30_9BACE|nr:GNAT family N-acetyltransferase [Bacteroides reticulotermitis]MBB4044035.1 dTDP-4-amino-4,6-dideoxy-D-galactose acyltransferase [Bacteroides reticulotermitis]GAE82624.1 WavS protein [Bacteroides reticulotermitis JCM 10512]
MPIERLSWDSQFFGIEVGSTSRKQLLAVSDDEINKYDLLYLMEENPVEGDTFLLDRNNLLVDCKLIYSKRVSNLAFFTHYVINECKDYCMVSEQLYQLAYLSGEYSRYKLDTNFALDKFEKMYRMWVDNSISGEMADYLYYIEDRGRICAFVTLKITSEKGVIGLIATDEYARGKGFGKALVLKCEQTLRLKRIRLLEVATQINNHIACKFYEKCGMSVVERTFIYHSWKY